MEKILGMYIVQVYFCHSSRGPGTSAREESIGEGGGGHAPTPDLCITRAPRRHHQVFQLGQ
jgi:hypothetical protein